MNESIKTEDENDIRTKNEKNLFESENKIKKIPIIKSNCSVCNSGCLEEIHELRRTLGLVELAEVINKKYNTDLNKDSLSRHFQHYNLSVRANSTLKLYEDFNRETENLIEHQNRALFLINVSFRHICERLEAGTLELGFEEFEKMINLYYKTLKDPGNNADEGLMAIFQKASAKYGCSLEQGVLIKMPKSDN